jgi:hypothetical protein
MSQKTNPDANQYAFIKAANWIRELPKEESEKSDEQKKEEIDYAMYGYDAALRADHWFSMPGLDPLQAAMLLCQFNPNETTEEVFRRSATYQEYRYHQAEPRRQDGDSVETTPDNHTELLQQLRAAYKDGSEPRRLIDWWKLAQERKLKHHPWIDWYIAAAGLHVPATAPAVRLSDASVVDVTEWQVMAQEKAREIIKRQKAKDLYPAQEDVADEIAKEFRRTGIVGAGGKPLAGSYIKRHALKGISSEQGRRLSITPRWGK